MSKVKVSYFGLIRNMVNNPETEEDLPGVTTVRELLRSLVQRYGDDFRSMMLTPDWQLLPSTIIQFNGRDINEIEGLHTKLADNGELSISVLKHFIGGG